MFKVSCGSASIGGRDDAFVQVISADRQLVYLLSLGKTAVRRVASEFFLPRKGTVTELFVNTPHPKSGR